MNQFTSIDAHTFLMTNHLRVDLFLGARKLKMCVYTERGVIRITG